jgi:imidazole glycerol-phosphate synthase subunit HisH
VLAGAPLLGICVGMQWLFEGSAESPECPGLGVLSGRCERLTGNSEAGVKVPHVGWNALVPPSGTTSVLLKGVAPGSQVYFTHSYAPPVTNDCVAATTHGAEAFGAAVERGRVFGVQFHPEKSSDVGLRILGNFLEVAR